MPEIAVVILNWNGRNFLEKFLPDVIEYSRHIADVVVADNASEDDSVSYLKANFQEVKIIENHENGGFAKGYNDALKQVNCKYYLLLNSDIRVTEGWLEPLLEFIKSDDNIAAIQPALRSFDDPEKFEYAGAAGGFIDRYGYPFCRGRIFQSIENDTGQYNDNCEIFWASGACMMLRRDIFHNAGGFDNDFFAHMEEIDLCWRIKNIGYKIMYCHDSVVYHVGGGTLPKSSSRKTYLNFRNNMFLLFKNLPRYRIIPVFIIRYVLDSIAIFKFLIEGHIKDSLAVLRAHASFWKNIKKLMRKRKGLKHHKVFGIYHGSIVLDHYLKGKNKYSQLYRKKFYT